MNIRVVRNKIKSVTNVKKITQAMQLVSAIKMKKAQVVAIEGKPYQEFVEKSIKRFTQKIDPKLSPLLINKEGEEILFLLITSNKGLCGAFNVNLFKFILQNYNLKDKDIVTVGKKGAILARHLGANIVADFSTSNSQEIVSAVFSFILEQFLTKNYSQVVLFYNKFVSSLRYNPTEEKLLPVQYKKEEIEGPQEDYLIEPSPEEIVDSLLRNYIEERVRFAVIESEAGEHSARMIAMKNATDNANDVIYNLTLLRNKLRQQKITYELLDMITAKESVEVS